MSNEGKNNTGKEELDSLRLEMRNVTAEIMKSVQKRMDIASRIGEVKGRLNMDVKDEKVEHEVRAMVAKLADETGLSREFAGRLLNMLLAESESVQAQRRQQQSQQQQHPQPRQPQQKPRQTHLGIFMRAKQLEASGKKIIHLEVGEPDYTAPQSIAGSLAESFRLKQYHYTDTRGVPPLRDAIARKAGVHEDQVMVTPGGRFAVFSAIASLLKPGQEIITIEPAWPAYRECADFVGARTRVLRTTLESGWTPDLGQLEDLVNPTTKMIALNYPNNPTGKVLEPKMMEKIVSLARDHKLYLLSDEVYSDYAFAPFRSVHDYGYLEGSISVSSFSKSYAMTGFRVGYAVAGKETIQKMAKVQAVGVTSVAEPMQYAALTALGEDPSENARTMKKRLDFLCSGLKEMSLRFAKPDGAMYVYPELPAESGEDITVVEKLLDMGVAIAPGSGFGDSYRRFVRISACQPEEAIGRGLEVMASSLSGSSNRG